MMIRPNRFNLNLLAVALLVLVCGCAHEPVKKINASVRLHQEMRADASGRAVTIELFRAQPFSLTIDKSAVLTESNVKNVDVVDAMGGFALRILFDKKGTWLLEQVTAGMRGKHLAIFSSFPPPGEKQPGPGRWLAAPLITERITNGTLVFTPDASREEAFQIANGLNNVAKKVHIDEPYDQW